MNEITCPECGALWTDDLTCIDYFHQMGFWELDYDLFAVHHLMVLSYYLQHPGRMSQAWLESAGPLLVAFVEDGASPQQIRQQIAGDVDSGRRDYTIRATEDSTAHYEFPVVWTMTVRDVVDAGIDQYYASVETWSRSILTCLRKTHNL